ncbi:DUF3298 and DUF4163 domain-containing protein [Ectobacillus panaciterrae]|uniref:DUF3298 and DUF4163 domain-containing protein n=1 Tax=Ectobacillus panaciterrae TaxID=363872 RepID=UPI00041ED58D|nr:DUF3298 and DUF4163 domain-containing protein [Ectobacillus panaciterrae]
MKLRYIVLIAYLFIAIVPNYVFAEHPVVSPSAEAVKVETEKKEGKTEYFEYQVSIPEFHTLKNAAFEKKLNLYYKTNILIFKKKLEKEAKKYYDDAKQSSLSIHPYVANADYKVTYNKKPLLSLYVNYYQYTGGAHGMYEWKANTFDMKLEKELALTDLFKENSSYEEKIREEITRQIQQNKDTFFPDAIEQIQQAKNLKYFLEPEHLIIYFPLYEIAPYSSGIPQFRIPYTLLQDDLKDEYRNILIDK